MATQFFQRYRKQVTEVVGELASSLQLREGEGKMAYIAWDEEDNSKHVGMGMRLISFVTAVHAIRDSDTQSHSMRLQQGTLITPSTTTTSLSNPAATASELSTFSKYFYILARDTCKDEGNKSAGDKNVGWPTAPSLTEGPIWPYRWYLVILLLSLAQTMLSLSLSLSSKGRGLRVYHKLHSLIKRYGPFDISLCNSVLDEALLKANTIPSPPQHNTPPQHPQPPSQQQEGIIKEIASKLGIEPEDVPFLEESDMGVLSLREKMVVRHLREQRLHPSKETKQEKKEKKEEGSTTTGSNMGWKEHFMERDRDPSYTQKRKKSKEGAPPGMKRAMATAAFAASSASIASEATKTFIAVVGL